jgi:hypothetical protein
MSARILEGLPPYGPAAIPFPAEWGTRGHEGLVVEFTLADGQAWTGNFRPGLGELVEVLSHPNGADYLVISSGALWCVNQVAREAHEISGVVDAVWALGEAEGMGSLVFSRQGISLFMLGREGIVWRTRRIAWDGIRHVAISDHTLTGEAYDIDDSWRPFRVDLPTVRVTGGVPFDE